MPAAKDRISQRLEMARRHVEEGRSIVARQRAIISEMKRKGHEVSTAEDPLDQFVSALDIFEGDYAAIKKDLENSN
jgi:hypothetical protein